MRWVITRFIIRIRDITGTLALNGQDDHIPRDLSRDYYEQRANIPGTLLISEETFPSARAGGGPNVPGIYNESQIAKWKDITDAEVLRNDGLGASIVSSSDLPISQDSAVPRPLSEAEITSWIEDYAVAAKNAIAAGFEGVEIPGANGYLIDQFLQDASNKRNDRWGGSVENRSRYRISPWSTFQGMRMESPALEEQFTHLVENLGRLNLAYLHIVEPRISGSDTVGAVSETHQDHEFLLKVFGREGEGHGAAIKENKPRNVAIASGRSFLANPDLPLRLARGIELNTPDRGTFISSRRRRDMLIILLVRSSRGGIRRWMVEYSWEYI
ncbi:uncharacterized protein BDV17DRAFT_285414 [Aspergillus undulatus]|uniref:uncharacterized protein n=1 Tax=Aspergillus undulatus TaxID=1810928 RepID=UPI003CCCB12C